MWGRCLENMLNYTNLAQLILYILQLVEFLCVMALKCVVHQCHQFTRGYKQSTTHTLYIWSIYEHGPFTCVPTFSSFCIIYILFVIYLVWKLIWIGFLNIKSLNRLFFRCNPSNNQHIWNQQTPHGEANTRDLKHHKHEITHHWSLSNTLQ